MRIHSTGSRLALGAVLGVAGLCVQTIGQTVRLGPPAQAVAQDSANAPVVGTGLITGQVVDASSGRPLSEVAVTMASPANQALVSAGLLPATSGGTSPGGAPRQVLTDGQGQFVFHSLNKGRHAIRASASGYVDGGPGQNRPNGPTQGVELIADDSKVGGVVIRMWKYAVITGTVVDEVGEPMVGTQVTTMRRATVNGQVRLSMSVNATTDDRGIYRMSNLVPGDYLVMTMSSQTTMPVSASEAYYQEMSAGPASAREVSLNLQNSGVMMLGSAGHRVGDQIFQSGFAGRSGGPAVPAPAENSRPYVYPTLVYPSASLTAQGTPITLASGETRTGIDLHLRLMPSVRVSGTVMGPDGPVRNIGVKLYPLGAESITGFVQNLETATSATDANGVFTFLGVTPGQYTLKVLRVPRPVSPTTMPSNMTTIEVSGPGGMNMMGMTTAGAMPLMPPAIPTEPTLWATMAVSVGDSDLTGLNVALRSGARVSGRVQFEGAKPPPAPDQLQRMNISLTPMEARTSGIPTTMVRVDAEGRFGSGGFSPGRYGMTGNVPPQVGAPPGTSTGWTLKSAMLNGRNLLDDPLQIDGEDISGVVMTFTDRTTHISGTVHNAQGQPDKTAEIVVFPADSDGWKLGLPNARRVRSTRSSQTGTYEFAGLPVGDYYFTALTPESIGDWQDPKFLEKLTAVATRVTVSEGDKRTQDLGTRTVK